MNAAGEWEGARLLRGGVAPRDRNVDALDLDAPDPGNSLRAYRLLRDYVIMLRQLKSWGCFDEPGGVLREALNRLNFSYAGLSATQPVGNELARHFRILVERQATTSPVTWPSSWHSLSWEA